MIRLLGIVLSLKLLLRLVLDFPLNNLTFRRLSLIRLLRIEMLSLKLLLRIINLSLPLCSDMLLSSTLVTLAMLLIVLLRVDTRRNPVMTKDKEWKGDTNKQVAGEKERWHGDELYVMSKGYGKHNLTGNG